MPIARRLLVVIGLGLLLAGCAQPPTETPERVVPAEFCGEYVFINLAFEDNKEKSLRLVLDTGSNVTLVDPDSIERVSGTRVGTGKKAKLSNLSAGPLRINTMSVNVTELDHIAQAFGDEHLDGILGFNAFTKLLLTIDYPGRQVRVATGTLPKPDGVEIFGYKGSRRAWLSTTVNGRRTKLLIDSGASSPIAINEKHALDWAVDPIYLSCSVRMNRIEERRIGRHAGDVAFGPVTLDQPIIEVTDGTELVGTDVLKSFSLTFDQRTKRMRMVSAGGPRVRLDAVRSSGTVATLDPAGFRIVHLVPGSPAEDAGLAVDDIIVSVNGHPVQTDGCAQRNDEPADTVAYVIERGGERHEITAAVIEMIP